MPRTEVSADIQLRIQRRADSIVYALLAPICIGLAVLYLVYALGHALFLQQSARITMVALALATSSGLSAFVIAMRNGRIRPEYSHRWACLIAKAAILNSAVHMFVDPKPVQSTNFVIIIVGAGSLFLSYRHFALIVMITATVWVAIVAHSGISADWVHYGFAILTSITLGSLIFWSRLQFLHQFETQGAELSHEQGRRGELQAENAERNQFISTLSHDLRTPLTSARALAELLQMSPGNAEAVQKLSPKLISAIDRTDRMIRDLLDVSRIRAGQRLSLAFGPADLEGIARQVLEDLSAVHGPRFVLNAQGCCQGYLSGEGLRRGLENLLQNAVKYGDPSKPITLTITAREGLAHARVHNWGNPITPEAAKRLFRPYSRIPLQPGQSGKEGWGLGLTLVRAVMDAHGGSVSVHSTPREGTTFELVFPLDLQQTGLRTRASVSPSQKRFTAGRAPGAS